MANLNVDKRTSELPPFIHRVYTDSEQVNKRLSPVDQLEGTP